MGESIGVWLYLTVLIASHNRVTFHTTGFGFLISGKKIRAKIVLCELGISFSAVCCSDQYIVPLTSSGRGNHKQGFRFQLRV